MNAIMDTFSLSWGTSGNCAERSKKRRRMAFWMYGLQYGSWGPRTRTPSLYTAGRYRYFSFVSTRLFRSSTRAILTFRSLIGPRGMLTPVTTLCKYVKTVSLAFVRICETSRLNYMKYKKQIISTWPAIIIQVSWKPHLCTFFKRSVYLSCTARWMMTQFLMKLWISDVSGNPFSSRTYEFTSFWAQPHILTLKPCVSISFWVGSTPYLLCRGFLMPVLVQDIMNESIVLPRYKTTYYVLLPVGKNVWADKNIDLVFVRTFSDVLNVPGLVPGLLILNLPFG